MIERNLGSWNSVINGLTRNGEVDKAIELFERMVEKNVVSWTTMVHGLSMNGMHEKALETFFKMIEEEGVRTNDLTLVSILSACVKIRAFERGMRIHSYISSNRFCLNVALGTTKYGQIQYASHVFDDTEEKDICT
ncbi:hypothetical protein ACH5RR_032699 [Cinchona calisaya]|uniref:Pentatricopeptide repeat-containing protein n=1 Tax=Cinchona calisaya TaxID=153742 RepID=A0ABD2YN84_9GENT